LTKQLKETGLAGMVHEQSVYFCTHLCTHLHVWILYKCKHAKLQWLLFYLIQKWKFCHLKACHV